MTDNKYTLNIPIIMNGTLFHACVDTGAQCSLLSENIFYSLYPDGKNIKNEPGPEYGLTASGEKFPFSAIKKLKISINGYTRKINFCIANSMSEILLGLNCLQKFKMNIEFVPDGVEISILGKLVGVFPLKDSQKYYRTNTNQIEAEGKSRGIVEIQTNLNIENDANIIVSSERSELIPTRIMSGKEIKEGKLYIEWENKSENLISIPKGKQTLKIEIVRIADFVWIKENTPGESNIKGSIPLQLGEMEIPKVNTILMNATIDNIQEKEEILNYSGSLGIPGNAARTIPEVIEEEIDQEMESNIRLELIDILMQTQGIVGVHDMDCGLLVDHEKKPIYLDVPLKAKIPFGSHCYNLSEVDENHLDDILQYLIFNGLAKPAPKEQQSGSPAFVIRRSGGQSRPPRVIVDVRTVNAYIDSPTATPSDSVMHVLKDIGAQSDYITSVDMRQAYYAIALSQKSMDEGVGNIYTKRRTITLTRAPTGLSLLPSWFRITISDELEKNEKGEKTPISDQTCKVKLWYDDCIVSTVGDYKVHLKYLKEVLKRFERMGLKLNLKKSSFCIDLNKKDIDLLGFNIIKGEIRPSQKKVEKLLKAEIPQNVKELQAFLGLFNFLRNLLVPAAVHHSMKLSELTSVKKEFIWTEKHTYAFNELKSILASEISKIHMPTSGQIRIIYSDASQTLMGAICFFLDMKKDEIIGYRDWRDIKHNDKTLTKLQEKLPIENFSKVFTPDIGKKKVKGIAKIRECFFKFIEIMKVHQIPNDVDFNALLIYSINSNIDYLSNKEKICKENIKEIKEELQQKGEKSEIGNEVELILKILGLALKRNTIHIKIEEKALELKFCLKKYDEILAPLILTTEKEEISLLLLKGSLQTDIGNIKGHDEISLHECEDPNLIYSYFRKIMDSEQANSEIKIQGHFTKAFSQTEQKLPIYQMEIIGLLNSLEHFKSQIKDSKLTILITDSTAAFFIFSRKVGESCKKYMRYSLKIALEYPQVRLLTVGSKKMAADFFSRMNLKKSTFFEHTLTPVCLDKRILEKFEGKLLSWEELRQITEEHPELIIFSERRMKKDELDFYLETENIPEDVQRENAEDQFQIKMLKTSQPKITPLNIFDKFINRSRIIEEQNRELNTQSLIDEGNECTKTNEVLFFGKKIVLPTTMYGIVALREHYLSIHGSMGSIKKRVMTFYHIMRIQRLNEIIEEITKRCLLCLVIKNNLRRKLKQGIFPVSKSENSIQLDFIEGLPQKINLLVIVNLYSRYLTVYVMKEIKTENVINCLINYLGNEGRIKWMTTDNASVFESKKFKEFVDEMGIYKLISSPYRPTARSVVERFNGILQQGLRLLAFPDIEHWKKYLPIAVNYLNRRKLDGYKVSPYELQFGILMNEEQIGTERSDLNEISQKHIDHSNFYKKYEANNRFKEKINEIEKKMDVEKEKKLEIRNKNKIENKYQIGDFVLVKNRMKVVGTSTKLNLIHEKIPYKVLEFSKGGSFYLKNLVYNSVIRRHHDELIPIEIKDELTDMLNLPQELAVMLYNLKYEDINNSFPYFRQQRELTHRITRSKKAEIESLESQDQEDFLTFLEELEQDTVNFLE